MSLLPTDNQQPSYYIRLYRFLRYNIEEVLIGAVMCLEALCILYAQVPVVFILTTGFITAIVIIALGGI